MSAGVPLIKENPWKLGEKKITIDKVIQRLSVVIFFTNLSVIDPCEKYISILGWHAWWHFLWLVVNLKQYQFFLAKQAGGHVLNIKSWSQWKIIPQREKI